MADDESIVKVNVMLDDGDKAMLVEVAYALPGKQVIIPVTVEIGATVQQAILASGVLTDFPEIDIDKSSVGIFSKKVKLDQSLQEKDRIEIYRPLLADPKEVRRRRAAEGKVMRKGGGSVDPVKT